MRVWKWVGLAGIAGVAATAVVVSQRERREWDEVDPDEIRSRLHERLGLDAPPVAGRSETSPARAPAPTNPRPPLRSRVMTQVRRIPLPGRSSRSAASTT